MSLPVENTFGTERKKESLWKLIQLKTTVKQEISVLPAMSFYHRSQLAHTRAIQSHFYTLKFRSSLIYNMYSLLSQDYRKAPITTIVWIKISFIYMDDFILKIFCFFNKKHYK